MVAATIRTAALSLVLLTACTDGSGGTAGPPPVRSVESRAEWCALIADVDDRFDTTDNSDADFTVKQAAYREIRDMLAQLEVGLDHVDAAVHDDIATTLAYGSNLANAVIGAGDERDAEQRLGAILAEATSDSLPGSAWIEDTCGVDVNG